MDNKTFKFIKKLMPYEGPDNLVEQEKPDIYRDISSDLQELTPNDIKKIEMIESTGGIHLKNPKSTASGPFQLVDSTRKEAEKLAKSANIDVSDNQNYEKDPVLMENLLKSYQNTLLNSKTGPKTPNLENMYMMHHLGKQGALNVLNNPNSPRSKANFNKIRQLLNKKHDIDVDKGGAKDLLELLKD